MVADNITSLQPLHSYSVHTAMTCTIPYIHTPYIHTYQCTYCTVVRMQRYEHHATRNNWYSTPYRDGGGALPIASRSSALKEKGSSDESTGAAHGARSRYEGRTRSWRSHGHDATPSHPCCSPILRSMYSSSIILVRDADSAEDRSRLGKLRSNYGVRSTYYVV